MTQPISREEAFRNKINVISILCAVLVVYLHSFSFNDGPRNSFAYHLEFFISRNIAQAAVPAFFAMSGFLFYRNFDLSQLFRKWKSRFHSLVIPYLLWNGISMLIFFVISRFSFISMEPFALNLENIFNGLIFYQYNLIFWFVFQLILLTYLCPVLYGLLKNRVVAVCLFGVLLTLYGLDIREIWFIEVRAVIYYGFGAYFALHHQQWLISREKVSIFGIGAFLVAQVMIYTGLDERNIVYILDRILLAVAVFDFSNLLTTVKVPRFLQCSFPIYAMHNLILEFFNKVFSFALSPESNWILLDYFLSPILTIAIIALVNAFLLKYTPKVHGVLFGGRVR